MTSTLWPSSLQSPPGWAQRFGSDDLDEVRQFVTRTAGEHSRVAHRPGAVGFELASVKGSRVTFGWGRARVEKTIRAAIPSPILHLVVPDGTEYRIGRRSVVIDGCSAMFLAPRWEITRRSPAGSFMALAADEFALAEEIEARASGVRGMTTFRSRSFDAAEVGQSGIVVAALRFLQATGHGVDPLRRAHEEARLMSAIAGLLSAEDAVHRALDVSATRLASLEDWIEAHLSEPLTIGRLCKAAGVGERALQKAFETRRGVSPMRFVAERRLAGAFRRLTARAPEADVTSVAMGLGFSHMGRFASLYRQAFGETPLQSLRRAVRERGVSPS